MTELKPCPFCGGGAETISAWVRKYGFQIFRVRCCTCKATGQPKSCEAGAIEAWNCRSTDGALSRLLSAAREIRDIEREGGGSMDRVDEYRERWEAAIPALCEALEEVEEC